VEYSLKRQNGEWVVSHRKISWFSEVSKSETVDDKFANGIIRVLKRNKAHKMAASVFLTSNIWSKSFQNGPRQTVQRTAFIWNFQTVGSYSSRNMIIVPEAIAPYCMHLKDGAGHCLVNKRRSGLAAYCVDAAYRGDITTKTAE